MTAPCGNLSHHWRAIAGTWSLARLDEYTATNAGREVCITCGLERDAELTVPRRWVKP